MPVTKETLTKTQDEALAAASEKSAIRWCSKPASWEIMHKSGKGLIALNIENAAKLKEAFKGIHRAAGKAVPILVQEMLAGNREFLAGMTRFAGFGACVIFGLGGVFTEIYRDTTIRMAPLTAADAQEMFADLAHPEIAGGISRNATGENRKAHQDNSSSGKYFLIASGNSRN